MDKNVCIRLNTTILLPINGLSFSRCAIDGAAWVSQFGSVHFSLQRSGRCFRCHRLSRLSLRDRRLQWSNAAKYRRTLQSEYERMETDIGHVPPEKQFRHRGGFVPRGISSILISLLRFSMI